MGHDVQVEIDKAAGGTFTTYDVISGVVKLTLTTPISLANIQVKLEGVSTTRISVPKSRNGKDHKEKLIQDVHKVLYDSLIVFPPENIRAVSSSKEFTLSPGNYKYPFHFKLPLHNACAKVSGVSNMILVNKNFDILVNNGNFNLAMVRNAATNFYQQYKNPGAYQENQQRLQNNMEQQQYHVLTVLPPSFTEGDDIVIHYFVKATCKRLSFLKANLRAFDPFNFVPLDLDVNGQPLEITSREVFFRKDVVFWDRYPHGSTPPKPLPDPPRKGLRLFFGSSSRTQRAPPPPMNGECVLFGVEVRFPYPVSISPSQPPPLRLYIVSDSSPDRYIKDPGLGVLYLRNITVELSVLTRFSVLETDGLTNEIHQALKEQRHIVCKNSFLDLEFNLKDAKKTESGLFEVEIPSKYYSNWELPHLVPTFQTCNITRQYSLTISVTISSEKIMKTIGREEREAKAHKVDLHCSNIRMLSGIRRTRRPPQIPEKENTPKYGQTPSKPQNLGNDQLPQLPQRPTGLTEGVTQLPTYDDAVRGSFVDSSNSQPGYDRKSS